MSMISNSPLNSIWKDWPVRAYLATLTLAWSAFALGSFRGNDLALALWDHGHLALIPIVLFGFQRELGRAGNAPEKRFWRFLILAYSLWWGVRVVYVAAEPGEPGVAGSLMAGGLYAGFYLAFLLAVESRPDTPASDERLTRPRRLEDYATVVFALGVLTYFLLLPYALHNTDPQAITLWHAMIVGLDAALLYRLVSAVRGCESPRWRTVYSLLAGAVALWIPGDLLNLFPGITSGGQPVLFDLFFDLSLLISLASAYVFSLPDEDGEEKPATAGDNAEARLAPNRNLILVYAFAFPVIHGAMTALGWVHADSRGAREVVVLLFLLTLGAVAFAEKRQVERVTRLVWQREFEEREQRGRDEARFRDLFENSNDLIQSVRADGSYEYVNPAWHKALGYSEEDLRHMHFMSVIASEERAHCQRIFKGLQEGENFAHISTVFLAKNGRRVHVEGSISAHIQLGELVATRGFFQDVTGRRKAEDARNASDTRFQVLFDHSPYGLLIVNEYGLIVRANPEVERMFGYEPGGMKGKTVESLIPERYQGGHISKRLSYFDSPATRPMKAGLALSALRKDGTEFPVEIALGPFETDGGTLVAASIIDVTRSKTAADALKASEERHRELNAELEQRVEERTHELRTSETKLLEAQRIAKMGNWEWDVDTNTARRSPEIYRIFGADPEKMATTKEGFFGCLHADDRERILEELTAVQKGEKERFDTEYRIIRPDGAVRWLHDSAEVVTRTNGQAKRFAGVTQDITEQRELRERLQQTQKVEILGRLAGGVAHDFNNLLMIIGGHTEMLRERLNEPGTPPVEVEEIQKAVDQASALTQQLLAFSRQQPRELRSLDLGAAFDSMRGMLQRLLGERDRIELHCSEDLWPVNCDLTQTQQVMMNLVANARDAQPGGRPIFIEAVNCDLTAENENAPRPDGLAPGHYVVVSVRDTGVGMDAETRARIFDPFFTTKEAGKGTGLGLAMVFSILQQCNGAVEVESEPGRGTTVHLFWPRAGDSSTPEEPKDERATAGGGGNEIILLVEDEAGVRRLARSYLESQGYTILESQDGVEGLELASQYAGRIDLLLTDVVMPRMSGPAMAEKLAPPRPDIKVIFMSGYADDEILASGGLPSDPAVLQKPFTLAELGQRVREALDARDRVPTASHLAG